jgi:Mrp family chromosome partitioning ATPase
LFVDCDLRRPTAHQRLDCPPSPGLSEILRGELGPDEAIQLTSTPGLHFIAAGRSDQLAVQALAQDPAHLLFDELKRRYDFVVVDTSPVLPVADTLLVAGLADAVIFSILRDVSRAPLVHSAYERLSDLGVRILGAVVVGTKGGAYGCEYNYPSSADRGVTVPP